MLEQNFEFEENNKIWMEFVKHEIEQWDKKYKRELDKIKWTKDDKEKYSEKINGDIPPEDISPYKYQRIKTIEMIEKKKKYILNFEECIKKPFSEITFDDYNHFLNMNKNKLGIKKKVRTFLFKCISIESFKNNDKNFLVLLLPEEYGEFIKKNFIQ